MASSPPYSCTLRQEVSDHGDGQPPSSQVSFADPKELVAEMKQYYKDTVAYSDNNVE
jgi:hypothetical protein